MAETIRVTVAPGCSIPITPHPSGIPGLPTLILHYGDTLDVSRDRFIELLRARLILDPTTGKVLPPDPPRRGPEGPAFSADGGKSWVADARHLPVAPPDPDR
ncbi:MAG: hypothetical protein ACRYG8_31535, partial [Janthinobacterium lividum]